MKVLCDLPTKKNQCKYTRKQKISMFEKAVQKFYEKKENDSFSVVTLTPCCRDKAEEEGTGCYGSSAGCQVSASGRAHTGNLGHPEMGHVSGLIRELFTQARRTKSQRGEHWRRSAPTGG